MATIGIISLSFSENCMKRLLTLILICLLPMQVFAGLLTYKIVLPTVELQAQFEERARADDLAQASLSLVALKDLAERAHSDGGESSVCVDSEDLSSHTGGGDEFVLNPMLVFAIDNATLASALRSDAASQPPFLPLAGRPPRI